MFQFSVPLGMSPIYDKHHHHVLLAWYCHWVGSNVLYVNVSVSPVRTREGEAVAPNFIRKRERQLILADGHRANEQRRCICAPKPRATERCRATSTAQAAQELMLACVSSPRAGCRPCRPPCAVSGSARGTRLTHRPLLCTPADDWLPRHGSDA